MMVIFCGALFMALQPSISGEDQTYTVNFCRNDTSATLLAEMVDIYVYTGSSAPDSPVDGSGVAVTGVSKLSVSNNLLSTATTAGQSLTIYTKTTVPYNKSNYSLMINNVEQTVSATSSGYKKYNTITVNSNIDVYITGLSKNTYPLVFYNTNLSGSDGNALAQMVDIYVYEGSNAPDSPFSGSGLASGVNKAAVTGGLLQASVTHGNSVTIYTNLTPAYSKSNYVVKDAAGNVLGSLAPENASYGKYGLGQITSDTNIFISGLAKNQYSITFKSGDSNYALSDRVYLYAQDGTTLISNWSNIKVTHGDSIGFLLKPQIGYDLSSATITVGGDVFHPSSQGESAIVLSLSSVKGDVEFTVKNVVYKKYNIYFKDENNNDIGTDRAKIIEKTTQANINQNYQMTWGSSVSFLVDLQSGYNRSHITVEVNGQVLTRGNGNYYTFAMNSSAMNVPQDTTIVIKGITLNKYNSTFSLNDFSFNGQVKMLYNEYDSSYGQTGSTVNFYPTSTPVTHNLVIPHGKDFQFYIQILNTDQYSLNYDGTTDENITYSSSDTLLDNIINASSVSNVESIVYNVNSTKTQVRITFHNVTNDINVQVKSLKKVSYTINFDVPGDAEFKNHVKLYKGLFMDFYSIGYFIKGDQIYGPKDGNFITSTSAVKSEKYYFVVNSFDGALTEDPGGLQCTVTSNNATINVPNKTVYSSEDFSVIKVFEISNVTADVTKESISVSISGFHFSQRNVGFTIGNEKDVTATVTNYSNEAAITNNSTVTVDYGDSLKFKIVANEGYYLDDISRQVTVTNSQNQNVSFEYASYSDHADITISNIREGLKVTVNLNTEKMPITFNAVEGFQYYPVNQNGEVDDTTILRGIVTVPYDNDYYFAVKAETGYNIGSVALKNNLVNMGSGQISGDYLIFKISSVKASVSITGSVSKAQHTVSFNTSSVTTPSTGYSSTVTYFQDGLKIAGDSVIVQYGGNTSFQVKLADECNQSDLRVYSSASSEKLSSVNGTYSITDITQDITVRVENLTLNQYVINFTPTDSAYYIKSDGTQITSGTQLADYNSSYSFGVSARPGYAIGSSMVVNYKTASGVTKSLIADASSGKYTIPNIKESGTISIENVDNIIYTITLAPIDGVTYYNDTGSVISGKLKIKYGQNFEFSVGVADAYDDSIPGMYIVVNDGLSSNVSAQKLSSGRYIISNVTQDINVKVGNITKNKYIVTLTKIEGIEYYGTSGKTITGDNEIEYKGSITFRVYLYPAYADSNITVMLGDNAMTSDSNGMYTIPGIDENKTVTVLGVQLTKEAELINKINSLPSSVGSLSDVNAVIEVTRLYNDLPDEKKKKVTNIAVLEALQEQAKSILHLANGVKVDGVDWYVKLIANPISSDADACSRIYGKLNTEYILSLYDIYLWDMINDKRYELPEGQSATITLPMPDMTYFENPTGVHEKSSDGKLEFPTLTLKSTIITFSTDSFSAMGVIADRSSTPGRSSLLDAVDANVSAIKEYALTNYNSGSSNNSSTSTATNNNPSSSTPTTETTTEETSGNISSKFKSSSNNVTVEGSALRLILVLMVIILIAVSVWVIIKNRKKINTKNGN